MRRNIVIRDMTGRLVARCDGPAHRGACPRVDIGDVVPCAGDTLAPGGPGRYVPFAVAPGETMCPITSALVMAGSPDVMAA
jgi:hypothetical protein